MYMGLEMRSDEPIARKAENKKTRECVRTYAWVYNALRLSSTLELMAGNLLYKIM